MSITESDYDEFYTQLREQRDDVATRLEKLQEAEDNYCLTAKYVLNLADRAYDLFISSEVEEKRQLITLVLQDVKMDGKKIVYDVQKPFDLMIRSK